MHNFYEEEDLDYTYMEGSTPSLDQASLEGFTGEGDGLVLMAMTNFKEPEPTSSGKLASRGGIGAASHSVAVGGGSTGMVDAGTQGAARVQSTGTQGMYLVQEG